jgi:UDP-N-acetylmuramoylalanine--D-glutamate ligase
MKLRHKRILVLGLGRAGGSVAQFLLKAGARVFGYDENPKVFRGIQARKIIRNKNFVILETVDSRFAFDLAIVSPGIPDTAPVVERIKHAGYELLDEAEFTSRFIKKPIIAVTGTNGKSTTAALVARMLTEDGKTVFYGGNLAPGKPFSQSLVEPKKDFYVVEVSSFQIERFKTFLPKIGLLLNITPDHLDRHPDFETYARIKIGLFKNQTRREYAIVNIDDPAIKKHLAAIPATVVPFSIDKKNIGGVYLKGRKIYYRKQPVCARKVIRLPGAHNLANALAAIGAAKILKTRNASIIKALKNFTGLPHRLEFVIEINGVKYINNSMCTNPAAGVASLTAFDQPVILIAGGREKNLPLDNYIEAICAHTQYTILIGENRERLVELLSARGYQNWEMAKSLDIAVEKAKLRARPGDTVLFSPGFASFGDFKDFQERGQAFKALLKTKGVAPLAKDGGTTTGAPERP